MSFGSDKNRRNRELEDSLDKDPIGWLGPGIDIEAQMKFGAGLVRLNTHYKGDIQCQGTIVVDEQGEIEAEMHARIISIAGKIKGTVHASERIEIKEHGLVQGDIYTPSLVIEPGGFFDGQCHMPVPEPQRPAADSPGKSL
ncbi:MAG TPA: polymer-forming cytoskeletal protein [Terriglobia bacterium]|nr:polymer-forming cytoskeletal protein [Terriglobia bacterium]